MTKKARPHDGASGRKIGRPKKGDPPRVPYTELDKLLVHGEEVACEDGESKTVVFPSYRELGRRFGVSNSLIAAYSKKHNCLQRRALAHQRTIAQVDQKVVQARAKAIAKTREDKLRMVDQALDGFDQALAEGRIRFDSLTDFNTVVRLKVFLEGGPDSRSEVHAALSLADIQERHRRMLKAMERSTPAERGEVVREPDERRALQEAVEQEAADREQASNSPALSSEARLREVGDHNIERQGFQDGEEQ